MKRYLLFEFGYWYPDGGLNDLADSFNSWKEIDDWYEEHGNKNLYGAGEYQVLDTMERKMFDYPSKEEITYEL